MSLSPSELQRRLEAIDQLFVKWDLGGSACIRFSELLQILQASQRLSDKDQQKWVKRLEAQIEQGRRFNSQQGSSAALNLVTGGVVFFGDATGEPYLDPKAFQQLVMNLTIRDCDSEFNAFVTFCEKAVREAADSIEGTKCKRLIWDMFRLLDTNSDGHVDLHELEALVGPQSKKQLTRWKHYLANKQGVIPQLHGCSSSGEPNIGSDDDDEEDVRSTLRLTLADFQKFILEYVQKREDCLPELLDAVRKETQKRSVKYIVDYKVHEIINEVMEDLLKEKPIDVLAGIKKSVERLQRTGQYAAASFASKKKALAAPV